jgi:putative ABC transport system ATP-binding protein
VNEHARPANGAVIALEHVSRTYRMGESNVHALAEVTLAVQRGEFVAIMGPSGSGKSTLLNVIGCLDSPSSGRYWLDGEPVERLSEDQLADVRQRRISFIFQTFQLVGRMTAARNVELPMIFAGVAPDERRQRAERALHQVGLAARVDHRPNQLSGGERQRVAIARAIVMEPDVLLADEPTGNLDSVSGGEIVAMLQELNARGLTIVLVTHDPNVAAQSQRIIRMRDGRVIADERIATGAAAPPSGTSATRAPEASA